MKGLNDVDASSHYFHFITHKIFRKLFHFFIKHHTSILIQLTTHQMFLVNSSGGRYLGFASTSSASAQILGAKSYVT